MMEDYQFTADWFGGNIINWQRYLSHLAGQANIAFLEIGCYEGRATVWLLGNILTHKTAKIDCIDVFYDEGYEHRFEHNIKTALGEKKVNKIKASSQIMLRNLLLDHYDAIYIDGSHTAPDVLDDAVLAFKLLKQGGIMIFDDYEWNVHQDILMMPKLAIDAFLAIYQRQYELLHKGYQVIIKKLS